MGQLDRTQFSKEHMRLLRLGSISRQSLENLEGLTEKSALLVSRLVG
jgi:hypothetical protein